MRTPRVVATAVLQQGELGGAVELEVRERVLHRVEMARLPGKVEEELGPLYERREPLRVAQVGDDDVDAFETVDVRVIAAVSRHERVDERHPAARVDEREREVRPDEAEPTGDQDAPPSQPSRELVRQDPRHVGSASRTAASASSVLETPTTGIPSVRAARIASPVLEPLAPRLLTAEVEDETDLRERDEELVRHRRTATAAQPPRAREQARAAPERRRARRAASLEHVASRAGERAVARVSARRTDVRRLHARNGLAQVGGKLRQSALVRSGEEDERLGRDLDGQRHAVLEPAHVLVDEVELEDVPARIGGRRDVDRDQRRLPRPERVRERRSQAAVDDDRAVARTPAIARANLGDAARPGRPDVAALVGDPHVDGASLSRCDRGRLAHDLEPRPVELRRRRPPVPVAVDLVARRVPQLCRRARSRGPQGSPESAASISRASSSGTSVSATSGRSSGR